MDTDLTIEANVVAYMQAATSEDDWNDRCEFVQWANGENYPAFWYAAIIASGVAAKTAAKWGGDADLHITLL